MRDPVDLRRRKKKEKQSGCVLLQLAYSVLVRASLRHAVLRQGSLADDAFRLLSER